MLSQENILKYLLKKDKDLKIVLNSKKKCPLFKRATYTNENLFYELAHTIVGQQISVYAAETIWKRMVSRCDDKKDFLNFMSHSTLRWARKQGLSKRKYEYINNVAKKIKTGELELKSIKKLSDKEAIEFLTSLRGIGRWTAEMFLMFACKRKDIFSMGDLALLKAINKVYKVKKDDYGKIEKITKKWSPYRSIVSWYLWEYIGS
ncbi:MAG: DNA-3-methyladenine glycosidase [Gammaproteobacteria bacterium]|nr:DNA-3-methyladenine glycosidase [Gammaproteobacteria bacterium]